MTLSYTQCTIFFLLHHRKGLTYGSFCMDTRQSPVPFVHWRFTCISLLLLSLGHPQFSRKSASLWHPLYSVQTNRLLCSINNHQESPVALVWKMEVLSGAHDELGCGVAGFLGSSQGIVEVYSIKFCRQQQDMQEFCLKGGAAQDMSGLVNWGNPAGWSHRTI